MSDKDQTPDMAEVPFNDVVSLLLGSKPEPKDSNPSETPPVNLNT